MQEWRSLIMSESVPKQMLQGEWHVGEYQGVIEEEFEQSQKVASVGTRTRHATQNAAEDAIAAALGERAKELEAASAKRLKVKPCDEEAQVPTNYARNVVAASSDGGPLAGVGDLMGGFARVREYEAQLQRMYDLQDVEAAEYEAPEKGGAAQPVAVQRLAVEREHRKVSVKIRSSADEVWPELDGIIQHVKSKEMTGDKEADQELEMPLAEAQRALTALTAGRDKTEAALKEALSKAIAAMQPNEPFDIDGFKEEIQSKAKDFFGAGGELGSARKHCAALRALLLRRSGAQAKLGKADKLRAQVHHAGESEATLAVGSQYLLNHTYEATKEGANMGESCAEFESGCAVEFELDKKVLKSIGEHKGFLWAGC